MAIAHKVSISFGLVHIPIALYTAVQDDDIHFNQLHKEDNSKVKYKKTCGHCGKEISSSDIVKGYEYDDEHFVIITDDDFEKIKTEKDKSIQIMHFADLNQISPIYYSKTYYATPEMGGDKAFELFRLAMKQENKIAIGKAVLGNAEQLLALLPTDEGIIVEVMYFDEEIKDIPKEIAHPEINEAELTMAKALISSMNKPFVPEEYKDEYQIKLKDLIEKKIAGQDIVAPQAEPQGNVIDLMQALQQSIEQNKPKTTKKAKGA